MRRRLIAASRLVDLPRLNFSVRDMPAMHRSQQQAAPGDKLRTIFGFCMIGFANTILPFLIFAAAYLIIPYPRPIVILLQTLPALATKLFLPHIIHVLPYWTRPVLFAILWVIAAAVINATPPNVPPIIRMIAVLCASISWAAGDVSWLGQLRSYGKLGLAGWGMGTGLGGIIVAVLPHALTVGMGKVLRACVGYAWYLVPMLLAGHYLVLPKAPAGLDAGGQRDKDDDIEGADDDTAELLVRDPPTAPANLSQRWSSNWKSFSSLISPYIVPLLWGFAGQAFVYPGFSRALGIAGTFNGYQGFVSAYGLCFQLGSFIARSSVLFTRARRRKVMMAILGIGSTLLLANVILLVVASPVIIFPLVIIIGFAAGSVYVETLSMAMEDKMYESEAAREFSLGVITVGELAGLILGGIVADVVESAICQGGPGNMDRWCNMAR